jgi:hypothetical protein
MTVLPDVLGIVGAAFAIALLLLRIKTMYLFSDLSPAARRTWVVLCWIAIVWIALWSLLPLGRLLVAAMRYLMA